MFGSMRVRHFGPRPLIEDASVTSKSTTIWNGEIGYRLSSRARLVLEAFNLFDAEVSDIDYFYASRLPASLRMASKTSTRIRRFRDPRGSAFSSPFNRLQQSGAGGSSYAAHLS